MKITLNELCILLIICAIVLIFIFSLILFQVWVTPGDQFLCPVKAGYWDVYYPAQVARNTARGNGLTTDVIFPATLSRFDPTAPQPDLLNPPFPTICLAVVMILITKSIWSIQVCALLFYFATITITFLLALKIFDWKIAALASLFTAVNARILGVSLDGCINLIGSVALCSLLFYALYSYDGGSLFKTALTGGILALCCLNDYRFVVFLPAFGWYIYRVSDKEKWLNIRRCSLAFLAVISPWLIRNVIVAGNPFYSLAWMTFPNGASKIASLLRDQSVAADGVRTFKIRIPTSLTRDATMWLSLTGPLLTPFFFIAILHKFKDARFEKLRQLVYVLILITVGAHFFIRWNVCRIFIPFVFIVATAYVFHLLDNYPGWNRRTRMAGLTVFVALNFIPVLGYFGHLNFGSYFDGYWDPLLKRVEPGRLLVSNEPFSIAWHQDRKIVAIPELPETYHSIKTKLGQKPAILLTDNPQYFTKWGEIGKKVVEGIKPEDMDLQNCLDYKAKKMIMLY